MAARLTERAGLVGVRVGGRDRLLERGEGRDCRRRPGADRGARRGVAGGRRWRSPTGPGALRRRRRDRRSPASPGPDGGTEAKPVGTVCLSVSERGGRADRPRPCTCPATAPRCASARPRSRMHLLRRLLLDELGLAEPAAVRGARAAAGGAWGRSRRSATPPTRVWRPVPDASLHVTLAFLGASDPAVVEPVGEVLRAAVGEAAAPALALAAPCCCRRAARGCCARRSPTPTAALAALQGRVAAGLVARGRARARVAPVPRARDRRAAAAARAGPASGRRGAGAGRVRRRAGDAVRLAHASGRRALRGAHLGTLSVLIRHDARCSVTGPPPGWGSVRSPT